MSQIRLNKPAGGEPVRFHVFKFRPSSHSEDYTLIATYADEEEARAVGRKLLQMLEDMKRNEEDYNADWSPSEASVSIDGRRVVFNVYTAGYLSDVRALLEKVGLLQSLECYENYQEIAISVTVPRGLSVEVAMVVYQGVEAEAIKWLLKNCGQPEIVDGNNGRIFKWYYRGDEIYSDGILYLGNFQFEVYKYKNWSVE
jgi:hypothetical protein